MVWLVIILPRKNSKLRWKTILKELNVVFADGYEYVVKTAYQKRTICCKNRTKMISRVIFIKYFSKIQKKQREINNAKPNVSKKILWVLFMECFGMKKNL